MAQHRRTRGFLALLIALALALGGLQITPARAADPCQVAYNGDTGGQALTYALVNLACATITFAPNVTDVTGSSWFQANRNVTIQGRGRDVLTIRHVGAASASGNVFYINAGVVAIKDLTIAG